MALNGTQWHSAMALNGTRLLHLHAQLRRVAVRRVGAHARLPELPSGGSNQWQSVAISGNQWQSVAISGNQWQSVTIPTYQSSPVVAAISGNQWQSVAISDNPHLPELPREAQPCMRKSRTH